MTTTLLTGLPRSGTTLVCACLNTLPNCVALTEPMNVPLHGKPEQAAGGSLPDLRHCAPPAGLTAIG